MNPSSFISPRNPQTPGGVPRRLLAGVLVIVVIVAMTVYWITSGKRQTPRQLGLRDPSLEARALDAQTRGSSHSVDEAADRAAAASLRAAVASGGLARTQAIGAQASLAPVPASSAFPGLRAAPMLASNAPDAWLSRVAAASTGASASASASTAAETVPADPAASAREMEARSAESRIFDEPAVRRDRADAPASSAQEDRVGGLSRSMTSGPLPVDVSRSSASPSTDASLVGALVNESMRRYAPPVNRDLAQREDEWQERHAQKSAVAAPLVARPAAGALVVEEGTIIPAVLTRRIDSEAPGIVTALVNIDVYDSRTARSLLLPKGSRLVGRYDNDVSTGQERLQFAFTRLILPDGSSFDLPGAGGSDVVGQAGLPADVDRHFFQRFGAALLIGMIADHVVAPRSVPAANAYGGGLSATGQVLVNTADAELHRNESIAPTLIVAEGTRLNVKVMRDMVFAQPYSEIR